VALGHLRLELLWRRGVAYAMVEHGLLHQGPHLLPIALLVTQVFIHQQDRPHAQIAMLVRG
jgi:hypothetical protein